MSIFVLFFIHANHPEYGLIKNYWPYFRAKWNDRHVKYLYAMAYTGGGLAESNLKFDNALLRTVLYLPGSRELCRESGRATHALRTTLWITCKSRTAGDILCGPSCVHFADVLVISWRERVIARATTLISFAPITIRTRASTRRTMQRDTFSRTISNIFLYNVINYANRKIRLRSVNWKRYFI